MNVTDIEQKRSVGGLLFLGILLIPFIFVWFLLRKGHSNLSRTIGFIWLVIAILIIPQIDNSNTADSSAVQQSKIKDIALASNENKDSQKVAPKASYKIPAEQSKLIEAIINFKDSYREAPNELKKSVERTKRGRAIQEALGNSRKAVNWVGTIKRMSTNSDGQAILEIILPNIANEKIIIKTWNNSLSDSFDNTLISQESEMFATISELSVKDVIYFTGNFLPSDKSDYIKEASLTEDGSMSNPEFIFLFKKVQKVK